jgi:hypothetical protein
MTGDYTGDMVKKIYLDLLQEKAVEGLTEEELKKLMNPENIKKVYKETIEMIASSSVKTIEQIMYEKVQVERAYVDEFLARQNQKWGKAFVASDALYICVLESAETYSAYVNEIHGEEVSFLYHALRNIHGRALQVYLEIICLIKNGFADGAYARWRSLYELSVISSFISENGELVAKAFVESADTNDRYEWARTAKCLKNYKKPYITFSLIQSNCELATKEWKKEYDFVNQLVHASPQGTMYRLGADTSITLPVGRTDMEMGISAIHSAISLVQITADYFTVFTHGDSLVAMLTFHKWVSTVVEYYKTVKENCFDN